MKETADFKKLVENSKKIQNFLNNTNTHNTARTYKPRIIEFFIWKQQDPEQYLEPSKHMSRPKEVKYNENVEKDMEDFLHYLKFERKPPLINTGNALSAIRELFVYNKIELDQTFWKRIRKKSNGHRVGVYKTPTTQQLRDILKDADIEAKAIFLAQMSSFSRINEILTIRLSLLEMEHKYPRFWVRVENSKNGELLRKRLSPEAKNAMLEYLKHRNKIIKTRQERTPPLERKEYDPDLVFPMSKQNAQTIWKTLLNKAGLYQLDPQTHRPVMGTHSLRRYACQHIGDENLSNFFRGEQNETNKAYFDYSDEQIDGMYGELVNNLFVLETPESQKYMLEQQGDEITELKKQNAALEGTITILNKKYDTLKDQFDSRDRLIRQKTRDSVDPFYNMKTGEQLLTKTDQRLEDQIENEEIRAKRDRLKKTIEGNPDLKIVDIGGVPFLTTQKQKITTNDPNIRDIVDGSVITDQGYERLKKEFENELTKIKKHVEQELATLKEQKKKKL